MTEPGPVDDVRDVFERYAEGQAHMSPEQLRKLMADERREDLGSSLEDAERLADEVLRRKHHIAKFTRRNLTLEDFNYLLFSTELNPPIGDKVSFSLSLESTLFFFALNL